MKSINFLFIISILCYVSCKPTADADKVIAIEEAPSLIPPTFQKCLDHHGIDKWKGVKGLEFTIVKPNEEERHVIDIDSRFTCIMTDSFNLVKNADGYFVSPSLSAFNGNPLFYHNIYFYFVAMPHVLADPGIRYETLSDFQLNDTIFHGVKISYDSGIGDADKDEYIVLSDKKTNEMKYLLYTVTYFSNEKSERWSAKRYDKWTTIKGVSLPTQMSSYKYSDNILGELRNTVSIKDIEVSLDTMPSFKFKSKIPAEQFIPTEE